MNINKALKLIRTYAGVTQTELNDRLGMGHTWSHKMEREDHWLEIQTIERYAKAFDIPMYKIIKFAEVVDECKEEFSSILAFASIYMEK